MSDFQFSLVCAFLAMTFWGLGDFLIQKTIRKIGNLQTLLWINLVAGLGLAPFILKDLPAIFIGTNIWSLIIMTIVGLFYSIFLFKAYGEGKLAVVEVLMIGELPFTVILGLIFFHEKINSEQVLIIMLILLGTLLISKSRKTWWGKVSEFFGKKKFVWEKGVLLALAAVVFSALYSFLTAVNSRNISALMAVWFPWMLGSLFLLIYIASQKGLKLFWRTSFNHRGLILLAAIIDTAAWVFYALAVGRGKLSVVTPIIAGYAVIAMFLGIRFNKERISRWQYLGATLVLLGVVIISFISD